jgi:hypothetical protein
LDDCRYHEQINKTEENKTYTVGATRALWVDERLMLRACSLTLALASRNDGLAAAVERQRVKLRVVEVLGADVARIFTVAKDMSKGVQMEGKKKKVGWRIVRMTQSSDFPSQSSPNKSDPS